MTKLHFRRFFVGTMKINHKELRLDTEENNYYTILLLYAKNTENLNYSHGEDRGDITTARREN